MRIWRDVELWPGTVEEARAVQEMLRGRVRIRPLGRAPRLAVGVDAAYAGGRVVAAACLCSWPDLEPLEEAVAWREVTFPYVPGYLSFREGPAMLAALEGLSRRPDVLFFDGQGIAHPRWMGIASHVGVLAGLPCVGCAKSRLVGTHRTPGERRGCATRLMQEGRQVGAVVRTRSGVRPVYVSPGHLVDIPGAVALVLRACRGYRLPEPIRMAHRLAGRAKREGGADDATHG